jgi:hypothetical protein
MPRTVHFVNMFFTSPFGACGFFNGDAIYPGRNSKRRTALINKVTCKKCKKIIKNYLDK